MIDEAKVKTIAHLAQLKLSEHEIQKYSGQLSKIISYFNQIEEVSTDNLEPMVTPTEVAYRRREDIVGEKMVTREELLENAPERVGSLIKVPPVV